MNKLINKIVLILNVVGSISISADVLDRISISLEQIGQLDANALIKIVQDDLDKVQDKVAFLQGTKDLKIDIDNIGGDTPGYKKPAKLLALESIAKVGYKLLKKMQSETPKLVSQLFYQKEAMRKLLTKLQDMEMRERLWSDPERRNEIKRQQDALKAKFKQLAKLNANLIQSLAQPKKGIGASLSSAWDKRKVNSLKGDILKSLDFNSEEIKNLLSAVDPQAEAPQADRAKRAKEIEAIITKAAAGDIPKPTK